MRKMVIVLVIIAIALASVLGIQIARDRSLLGLIGSGGGGGTNSNNGVGGGVSTGTTQTSSVLKPIPVVNSNINSNSSSNININGNATAILNAQTLVYNQIFKNVKNSVIQITSKVNATTPSPTINGNPFGGQATRLGSGFIQDATKGLIITNNHVTSGSSTVDVTFVDGNTYSAKVIGTDAFSDLAVLQITDNFSAEQSLISFQLGNSSQLVVGEQVIAIGNPFALSDTMTNGIISQVGRLLPNQEMGFSIPDVIQTNAAINPGNSGGPLLDIRGNVIGVNSAISSQTGDFAGVGFAIPANTVARIVPYLIKAGTYQHPYLGISGVSLTPDLAQQLSLPRDFRGVVVAAVSSGSPAEKAGIIGRLQNNNTPAGDIITALDGHKIKRVEDIISYIEQQKRVGDNVVVTVYRNGQSLNLTATLQARPLPTLQQPTGSSGGGGG